MDKEKENLEKAVDSAWCMFEQTGNISYYLLYKKLDKKDK